MKYFVLTLQFTILLFLLFHPVSAESSIFQQIQNINFSSNLNEGDTFDWLLKTVTLQGAPVTEPTNETLLYQNAVVRFTVITSPQKAGSQATYSNIFSMTINNTLVNTITWEDYMVLFMLPVNITFTNLELNTPYNTMLVLNAIIIDDL